MELLQLRYFCVVAKHQNVTKAAAELMISQPSLSKTLKALEREVGQALFERRGKYIRLNRQGEIFYENISKSLMLLDDTVQALSETSHTSFSAAIPISSSSSATISSRRTSPPPPGTCESARQSTTCPPTKATARRC